MNISQTENAGLAPIAETKSRRTTFAAFCDSPWTLFVAATLGYGLFYVCRLSLSVVKGPLIGEGLFSELQLGFVGSALFYSYAIGKLVNGFLADRLDVRKFAAISLLISAAVNFILGFHAAFPLFVVLWLVNGWVQSAGAPCFILGLTRRFSAERRGTVYGMWSASHNIGEALTFVVTAVVVSRLGWRSGWLFSAALGFVGFLLIWFFFRAMPPSTESRPQEDFTETKDIEPGKSISAQWHLLKNPALWLISLASMFMYVSRYSINSWGIFFLEHGKGYSTEHSSMIISVGSLCGVIGTMASGWISDKWFNGERIAPSIIAGILNTVSIGIFALTPGVLLLDIVLMVAFGLTIGSLLCYLGGLMAVDIADKGAAGAALGVVGMASYAGAGTQDIVNGYFIGVNKAVVDGITSYNFVPMALFWTTAASLSCLVTIAIWQLQRRKARG